MIHGSAKQGEIAGSVRPSCDTDGWRRPSGGRHLDGGATTMRPFHGPDGTAARSEGSPPGTEIDLAAMSVSQLLGAYARILAELRSRGVVRTNNAPVGDYAELLVARALAGELASNASEKSYDLIAPEWGRVQVKARAVNVPVRASQAQTSPFRSWDFDHAALVMVRLADYAVHAAYMAPASTVREHASWRAHVGGHVAFMRPPLIAAAGVIDITEMVVSAARRV